MTDDKGSSRMLGDNSGPFGVSALAYIKSGWPEVLPIWRGSTRDKQPMVSGYHGREGTWPDKTTTQLWAGRYARANIALRLPRWVIGLDVDDYDDKHGAKTLAELEDDLGRLPATLVTTSRDDPVSGIRLYALPGDYVETAWPSQAGPDIEVITWYERYAICRPSMHKRGTEYRWWIQGDWVHGNAHGDQVWVLKRPPRPSGLPTLPVDWCEYLASLQGGGDKWNETSYDGSAREWMEYYGQGDPCEYMAQISLTWINHVMEGGSAHEGARDAVSQAIKATAEGHEGLNSVLWPIREAFIDRVGARGAGERRRGEVSATDEWRSMVAGAIAKYGGAAGDDDDPCEEWAEVGELR